MFDVQCPQYETQWGRRLAIYDHTDRILAIVTKSPWAANAVLSCIGFVFRPLLSLLGQVSGGSSLAGFILIGMGQTITRCLRPGRACVSRPNSPSYSALPRRAQHPILFVR